MSKFNLLHSFLLSVQDDPRISVRHIGVYVALLNSLDEHEPSRPIDVFSHEVNVIAKITARATYYKTIGDLNKYGYIKYEPSFKKNRGSKVSIVRSSAG
jgi:hypothetical protein